MDVRINNVGGHLVVTVVENPVIGRGAFEGNKKVKDEQLTAEVPSKARDVNTYQATAPPTTPTFTNPPSVTLPHVTAAPPRTVAALVAIS